MLRVLIRQLSEIQVSVNSILSKRVENLANLKLFTLEECKKEVIHNWEKKKFSFLSGVKVSETELEMLVKIADCLKDEELGEEIISIQARKEICRVLGCDMWEVTKFIILHKTHKRMHEFIIGRMMRKESLPKSEDEIKKMMLQDPLPNTKTSRFITKRRQKYSKKQQKYIRPKF